MITARGIRDGKGGMQTTIFWGEIPDLNWRHPNKRTIMQTMTRLDGLRGRAYDLIAGERSSGGRFREGVVRGIVGGARGRKSLYLK